MAESTAPKKYRAMGATRRNQYADREAMKYPVHDEKRTRAAISYFSNPANANKYAPAKRAQVWGRIKTAAKRFGIEIGEGSGPLSKSINTLSIVPPSYTWMGYDLYPLDNGPARMDGAAPGMAQTAGSPPLVAVLGSNLQYDPYPLTWVFAMKLDDVTMYMGGAYYLEDLESRQAVQALKRSLEAGSITRTDSGGGSVLRGEGNWKADKVVHVLAPGHQDLDSAHEAVRKALPGHSVIDIGWPIYSSREPCPTVMFHSMASGQSMLSIEPHPESIPQPSDNPPMAGNRLYAGLDPYMEGSTMAKNEHYTGAEILDEMQKSIKSMRDVLGKSMVVDPSFPMPTQKTGDGDHDADDMEDGHKIPGILQWPDQSGQSVPHGTAEAFFASVGLDLGDIGAPSVPGPPPMAPEWTAGEHPNGVAQFPAMMAQVATEPMYKCMECNEPMRYNMDGGLPSFCQGCGSMHKSINLPGLPPQAG